MSEEARTHDRGTGDDFNNLEIVAEVLVGDDRERLAALREFCIVHGMTDAEVDASIAARRLRQSAHADMARARAERIVHNPAPTSEEYAMGAFIEDIEPQVRDAVQVLRQKGYNTTTSGFSDFHHQVIGFADFHGDDFDAATRERLAVLGVTIEDRQNAFACSHADGVDLDQLRDRWNAIAIALPDRGHRAAEAATPAAQGFRRKFGSAPSPQ
jgi:hypothetical protein